MKVLITGASSGLGSALAKAYAERYGSTCQLVLFGRNEVALYALAKKLHAEYQAVCAYFVADVRNAGEMQALAVEVILQIGLPDVIIANAGVSRGTLSEYAEDIPAFRAIFETNVFGLLHTFQPFIPAMKQAAAQGKTPQLVGIASVAGIRGLPGAGAYSASKAAAITYLESLRVEMQHYGIAVTTIAPGYIRTPMTDINTYRMPFLMDADLFAYKTIKAIEAKRRFTVIPWQMAVIARLMRLLPALVWDWMASNAPRKSRASQSDAVL